MSGRAFYRAWLAMERAGLKGCPMSVLADWDESRDDARTALRGPGGPAHRQRIPHRPPDGTPGSTRARLPVDELIV